MAGAFAGDRSEQVPELLAEGFLTQVQVEESRTIDNETAPIDLARRYILIFWKRQLEQQQRNNKLTKGTTLE